MNEPMAMLGLVTELERHLKLAAGNQARFEKTKEGEPSHSIARAINDLIDAKLKTMKHQIFVLDSDGDIKPLVIGLSQQKEERR